MRGFSSVEKQANLKQLLIHEPLCFILLTEIKHAIGQIFERDEWSCDYSECNGRGGAAIFLNKAVFKDRKVIGKTPNSIAVLSRGILFVSYYIPKEGSMPFQQESEMVLKFIKDNQSYGCIFGGDWNKFANDINWFKRLETAGLDVCPSPVAFTFISSNNKEKTTFSLLDRVATNMSSVHISQTFRYTSLSDHLLLFINIGEEHKKKIWYKRIGCQDGYLIETRQFPMHILKNPDFQKELKHLVEMFKCMISSVQDVQRKGEIWDSMKKAIIDLAHQYAHKKIMEHIMERKMKQRLFGIIMNPLTKVYKRKKAMEQYKRLEFTSLKKIRQERMQQVFTIFNHGAGKNLFKQVRKQLGIFKEFNISDFYGHDLTSFATSYYQNIFSLNGQEIDIQDLINGTFEQLKDFGNLSFEFINGIEGLGEQIPDFKFTPEFIKKVIGFCPKHKASGPDSIPIEIWKFLKDIVCEPLSEICNFASLQTIPKSWQEGKIILLSKSGGNHDLDFQRLKQGINGQEELVQSVLDDTRPITLLNSDYKIFSKGLAEFLGQYMSKLVLPEQRAFIKGHDIRQNVILVQSLLYRPVQPDGAIISLDWTKAYDRMSYEYIDHIFKMYKFPLNLVQKFEATMRDFKLRISSSDGKIGQSFQRERGVGQGCPMAPLLFSLAINPLAVLLKKTLTGINVISPKAGSFLTNFSYFSKVALCADDVLIFVSSLNDVLLMNEILKIYMRESGARLNMKKTKALLLGQWKNQSEIWKFKFQCQVLYQSFEHFNYLGHELWLAKKPFVSNKDPLYIEFMERKMYLPWFKQIGKFQNRLEYWSKIDLPLFIKAQIAKSLLLSCYLYHASCSPVNDFILNQVDNEIYQFIWKGKHLLTKYKCYLPVCYGGIGIPNFYAICNAFYLRFFALSIGKDEDWAWALLSDMVLTIQSKNQEQLFTLKFDIPLKQMGLFEFQTLGEKIVQVYQTFISKGFLKFNGLNFSLNVNLKIPQVYIHPQKYVTDSVLCFDQSPLQLYDPITGHRNSKIKLTNDQIIKLIHTIFQHQNVFIDQNVILFKSPCQVLGFIKDQRILTGQQGELHIARKMILNNGQHAIFSYGLYKNAWSWGILPAPFIIKPFQFCTAKNFVHLYLLKQYLTEESHVIMYHQDWCTATWYILKHIPLIKVYNLIYQIGIKCFYLPPISNCTCWCNICKINNASLEHILFECPLSQDLWSKFDHYFGTIKLQPCFKFIFAGINRRFDLNSQENSLQLKICGYNKYYQTALQAFYSYYQFKMSDENLKNSILDMLYIYHVWNEWWLTANHCRPHLFKPVVNWYRILISCFKLLPENMKKVWLLDKKLYPLLKKF